MRPGVLLMVFAVGMATAAAQEMMPPVAAPPLEHPLTTAPERFDFGDFSSQALTTQAWQALKAKDDAAVAVYTGTCVDLYEEEAVRQQAGLRGLAPADRAFEFWALNDVATSLFIRGESLRLQGRFEDARAALTRIVQEFPSAQCWDPRGWFWSVAFAAQIRLQHVLP